MLVNGCAELPERSALNVSAGECQTLELQRLMEQNVIWATGQTENAKSVNKT